MQYSVWYDDSLLAVCFWRELPEQNIVKLARGIKILAPSSRRIEIFLRQTFNFASAFRQYDYTSAVAGNPDTVRVRLAQHVFQNDTLFSSNAAAVRPLTRSKTLRARSSFPWRASNSKC